MEPNQNSRNGVALAEKPGDSGFTTQTVVSNPQISSSLPATREMYIPPWPGLTLSDLTGSRGGSPLPYPFNAPRQSAFCVARSGIYHLFRALDLKPGQTVLMPDYHSGNEVAAVRAAGAEIVFYPILRNLEPDWARLEELVAQGTRVLYVIHYLGWAQPMHRFHALAKQSGAMIVEDCALSLLAEADGAPLGSTGDYSVYCVYKTLPVPNGGLLVQNNPNLPALANLSLEPTPTVTAVGRTAELALEAFRSRFNWAGKTLFSLKQSAGRMLRSAEVRTVPVGDIGWDIGNVNVGMAPLGNRVIQSEDYGSIVRIRRANYLRLRDKLRGRVHLLREDFEEGVCPLFFPVLVSNKHEVVQALRARGIQAIEFWNDPLKDPAIGPCARYLRNYVLELPIHQGVTPAQVDYVAQEFLRLNPSPAPEYKA